MRKFLKKLVLFCVPFFIFFLVGFNLDILKVFKSYSSYYDNDNLVALNRTLVSTKILLKNNPSENYNAFIFGSSRSQAFKAELWKNYLPENANVFHYDGYTESLYGIYKKIEFLDLQHIPIKHALIVIDRSTLAGTKKRDTHHQINPIAFNDVSEIKFYWVNLKASLNPKLIISYLDYSLFKTYRPYMKNHIRRYKYPDTYTPITNDTYYDFDKLIAEDSIGYYKLMKNKFYKRLKLNNKIVTISNEEIRLLKSIKSILEKHNTSYKIVISPIYDQIPIEKEQLELLQSIFNTNNIYNFSGDNALTRPMSNYYEQSHYRPIVANKILDSIY